MPSDLPLGNGNLLVNFDKDYNLRDIYYPYVGKALWDREQGDIYRANERGLEVLCRQ